MPVMSNSLKGTIYFEIPSAQHKVGPADNVEKKGWRLREEQGHVVGAQG